MISDGAEIPEAVASGDTEADSSHNRLVFHIAMKIQPMQQIADHIVRSRSDLPEAFSSIDREIKVVKWRPVARAC